MKVNGLCSQQMFSFVFGNMGLHPTSSVFFCDYVYQNCISNHRLERFVHYWWCNIENYLGILGVSTSITRKHTLESFRKLTSALIFFHCSMLAHQAAHKIQESLPLPLGADDPRSVFGCNFLNQCVGRRAPGPGPGARAIVAS